MNNCIRTNLFSAFDCIWLLERLPQVSAQREHTIVCLLFMLHLVVGTIMHAYGYNTVEHSTTGANNCTGGGGVI